MNNIIKEIKSVFDFYKRLHPQAPVCSLMPFSPENQLWMYHYLFPEMLLVYDEWVQDEYKKRPELHTIKRYSNPDVIKPTLEEYKKIMYTNTFGEALLYPCWVLPEEEVIRIMAESGII